MDLSTHKLISILYETNKNHVNAMVELAANYDLVVSDILKGWNRIDSKLCVKLLHITCEWNSDRIRLPNRTDYISLRGKMKPTLSETDKVFLSYYKAIWEQYSKCFKNNVCYIMTVDRFLRK